MSMRAFKTRLRSSLDGFWQIKRDVDRASSHCPNKTWLKKHCSWCFWEDSSSCWIRRESDAAAVFPCSMFAFASSRTKIYKKHIQSVCLQSMLVSSLFTCGGRHLGKSCAINTHKLWPLSPPIKHDVVFGLVTNQNNCSMSRQVRSFPNNMNFGLIVYKYFTPAEKTN